ncbi:insulinase family protein [Halomonas aquamarina]|uniref:Insulinase family protein n=1 Tax=Vreelandella aquamarina TaxID=77097 RepID=A0ACC5VV59_9GAMM|nr:pitrilysin family protein [Halomonas aquamarina]MBZ5488032.1 insulinase family protein [Halomonas aquamarina]
MGFFHGVVCAQELAWDESIKHGRLDNGFNYVMYNSGDPEDPFNLRLIVNAGSVDDEQRGMAHIVEHMVFRSNRAHERDVLALLDGIGWETGKQINAVTRQTQTQFMIRTRPDDALDIRESIALLNDLAFGARMTDDDWSVEREVIFEEMRRGQSVASRVNDAKKAIVRNGSRYVDRPTMGALDDIQAITAEQVEAFYKRFYVPSNMTLVVSGYIDTDEVIEGIQTSFGQEAFIEPPAREYVELPLASGLVIGKVQDEQGTSSEVTYGFRSPVAPYDTLEGQYARLQNYFIRKLLFSETRNTPLAVSSDFNMVSTLRSSNNERLITAISAKTTDYENGLEAVLSEIERLGRDGFQEDAFETLKDAARQVVQRNLELVAQRNFAQWEDKLTEAVLKESVEENYSDKSARLMEWIDAMTLEELNARLHDLLSSPDQFLFYQVPGELQAELPDVQEVRALAEALSQSTLPVVERAGRESLPPSSDDSESVDASGIASDVDWSMMEINTADPVSHTFSHDQESVTEWQLENGDRVVWLDRPTPNDDIYIKALSSAGYVNDQLSPWLSRLAVQIWEQADLDISTYTRFETWEQKNAVDWSWSHKQNELDIATIAARDGLNNAFRSYVSRQNYWRFDGDDIADVRRQLLDQINETSHVSMLEEEFFSVSDGLYPTASDVEALTADDIVSAISELQQQPVTVFLVGELSEEEVLANILPYVSSVHRERTLSSFYNSISDDDAYLTSEMFDEQRALVKIKSEHSYQWTPERAFLVSTLNPIIKRALKRKLRHELGGVYTLRFEVTLDRDNKVRAETRFETGPDKVSSMLAAHEDVMESLADWIENENFDQLIDDVHYAERVRLDDPNTWLRRLALSYEAYASPRYLNSFDELGASISKDALSSVIDTLLPMAHQSIFVGLPVTN